MNNANSEPNLNKWTDVLITDDEIPAWKRLDLVVRKWAVMSAFEKDQENYQKLKDSIG